MRRISLCLSVIVAIALIVSGCRAVNAEQTNLTSAGDEATSGCDQEAYAKIAKLVNHSSKQSEAMGFEYAALIKSAVVNEGAITISFDKIEPTNNEDPQGEFYINADELIQSITLTDNVIILADPHNNYKAITADGLNQILAQGDTPFCFYSISGEVSVLIEMMLP